MALHTRINDVHKKPLHEGQIRLAKAYFDERRKIVQSQWARDTGKTESILYNANRKALTIPNSLIYIITPERKQGREIYWASGRLQNYAPPEYVDSSKSSELRQVFKNGSFIAVDGQENYDALRGIKPTDVFYDEFQHHSKDFHVKVMEPNLMRDIQLFVYGTPPERDCYYYEFKKQLLKEILEGDTTRLYLEFGCGINPAQNPEELEKKKKALISQGDEAIWLREYMGQDCLGGKEMIFPLWRPDKTFIWSHDLLLKVVNKDANKLRFFTICDPGTTSIFAVLFCAYDPYNAKFYILDEIYEKDRKKMHTRAVFEEIKKREAAISPNVLWRRVADEAAAWFRTEVRANFGENVSATKKPKNKQKEDWAEVSIIKAMMAEPDVFQVSDKCKWLSYELTNYVTNERGEFPDFDDHLIDCLFYAISASRFTLIYATTLEDKGVVRLDKRPTSPEEWIDNAINANDSGDLPWFDS